MGGNPDDRGFDFVQKSVSQARLSDLVEFGCFLEFPLRG